jgi:hypothetical protein
MMGSQDRANPGTTGRIVRWEILPGLPGNGPVPKHFHTGHPTPWAEGFVVRFWNADGSEWVGNFEPWWSGCSKLVDWPEANSIAVIAGGNFYLIDARNPDCYSTLGPHPHRPANDIGFDEQRQTIFVAGGYFVYTFDMQRRLLWEKGRGGYINRIVSCRESVLTVEIDPETGEPLETAQIFTGEESVDDRRYLDILFSVLEERPEVESIGPGLSASEIQAVERQFKCMFPPDLRRLLQFAMPIGPKFPNWRDVSGEDLQGRFDWPLDGICFDVEHANFWLPEWGRKPSDPEDRRGRVRRAISQAPRLIPIFAHRYIPVVPHQNGNPVFSVYQTDIIYYGNDLAGYFHNEFGVPLPEWAAKEPRPVQFWDDALNWRDHEEYYEAK